MKKINLKTIAILSIFLVLMLIPAIASASNEGMSIVKTADEHIIYVEEYLDKEFSFAFSNDENAVKESLSYVRSGKDTENENNVAYLNETLINTYALDTTNPVYMWIKDGEEYTKYTLSLAAEDIISQEQLNSTENITKIIKVDTTGIKESEVTENKNTIIRKRGYIKITDSADYNYSYMLVELKGLPETNEYQQLMKLAKTIKSDYEGMTKYQKLQISKEFYDLYTSLIQNASWTAVTNMEIDQPEDAQNGDEIIVFLKKESMDDMDAQKEIIPDAQEETILDAQFMTCLREDEEAFETEKLTVKEPAGLPKTYDSIILIVVAVVLVAAIVLVYIRMRKLKKNENK